MQHCHITQSFFTDLLLHTHVAEVPRYTVHSSCVWFQKYYKAKGDRPLVRPQLIAPSLAEYKSGVEAFVNDLVGKVKAHHAAALIGTLLRGICGCSVHALYVIAVAAFEQV